MYSDSTAESEQMLNRMEVKPRDQGAFRTPTLRNVAVTAPYFHTGEFPTLLSVIEFKNDGGFTSGFLGMPAVPMGSLGLSERELNDLIAFLETLTGELPPAHLLNKIPPSTDELIRILQR